MRFVARVLAASLFLAGLSVLPANAQEVDPFPPAGGRAPTKVEFFSEVQSVAPGQAFTVAVKLSHPPGWHSYFINTGGVGMIFDPVWTLPEGFKAKRVAWPIPHIGETAEQNTYGYDGIVYHLFQITPPAELETGAEVTITTAPTWQICDLKNCVPEPNLFGAGNPYSIKLAVEAEAKINPASADAIKSARAMLPKELPGALTVQASKDLNNIILLLTPASAVDGDEIHFFDFDAQIDAQAEPEIDRTEEGVRWTIKRNKDANVENPERLAGVLTIGHEGYAVDVEYGKAAAKPITLGKLMAILGGMFIGGMILNLMPCVFPVIGLKIMGFVQQAGEDRKTIFVHGLIYAGGVILSFWVLSGLLLAIREGAVGAGGQDVSWGYQLQNPWVVWATMLVMFVLALNMYGVFEIGTSATSVGSNLTHKQGVGGSFFSGVLATVVATPCSAPFLGVAIGLAFGLSPFLFMLAFTFMALGLAFPYVLLSAFPKLVENLPRPGAWMESFKQAMSFLLFGTAGFLLWVYVAQIELASMLNVVVGLTAIAIGLWIYGRWCTIARAKRTRQVGFALVILFSALGFAASKPPAKGLEWQTWTPEAVEAALDEGRPVYVDFTATWCLTCQVNKSRAYPRKVQKLFDEHKILALKADYTNYAPEIAKAISELGRNAVPVNVLYVPGEEEAHLTKELFGAKYMRGFLKEHLGEPQSTEEREEVTKK